MGSLAEERPRAQHLADILKALAHPVRLRIIAALCEGEESVIELARRLNIKQAIVSQQLRILRMSSLVAARRENGFSCYGLAEPRLRELVQCLDGCHNESSATVLRGFQKATGSRGSIQKATIGWTARANGARKEGATK
jgi:DNA-binding transcriptional ArsR family regulator